MFLFSTVAVLSVVTVEAVSGRVYDMSVCLAHVSAWKKSFPFSSG